MNTKFRIRVVLTLVGAASTVWVASCASDAVRVRVISPSVQDVEVRVTTAGKVTPANDFHARANFSGIVEKIYVRLGQRVRVGQMLAQMKDPYAASRLASAKARLKSEELSSSNVHQGGSQEDRIGLTGEWSHAQSEEEAAAVSLSLLQRLHQAGAASPAEVEEAQRRLTFANATLRTLSDRIVHRYSPAELSSWDARVAEAKALVNAEKTTYANANITSQTSGTVYLIPVSASDFVPSGADLLRIADLSRVQVRAVFDEPDMGSLAAGQRALITWEGRPNRVWHGHIELAPMAAMASGTRNVGESIIDVDDANRDLPPGTNVTVGIIVEQHKHVLSIPRQALHERRSRDCFVYRVVDGVLVQTSVQVGLVSLDRAEITNGLTSADKVALENLNQLEMRDGMRVEVAE